MARSRLLSCLLVLVASCQGDPDPNNELPPISDWPRGGSDTTVSPVTVGSGAGSTGSGSGTTAGGATIDIGALPVTPSLDAGVAFPTSPADAGRAGLDAGAQVPPFGGAAPNGSANDAGVQADGALDAGGTSGESDAGCPALLPPDAGMCAAYGCRLTLDQLRGTAKQPSACTASEVLGLMCDGSARATALSCTEMSVFAPDLSSAVTTCMKREASLSVLNAACLDCFVDDALCTLSRCFAVCALATEARECQNCRRQECGTTLSQCTGVAAP